MFFIFFLGERIYDTEVIKKLIKVIFENYKISYITFTSTFSICPNHGYLSGEYFKCPYCNENCEVYSRVVGYLRPVQQWNYGKQDEFLERKKYKIPERI